MARRTVSAKEVVQDIRSGMNDAGLMEKYGLSPEWLPIMFSKLLDAGLITQPELDQRLHSSEWSHIIDTGDLSELEDTTHIDEFEKTVDLRELERAELFEPDRPLLTPPPKKKPKPGAQIPAAKPSGTPAGGVSHGQLIADISAGIHYHTLMQKYRLSEEELRARVKQLVEDGRLARTELEHWSPLSPPSLLVEAETLKEEPTTTVDLSRFVEKKPQPEPPSVAPPPAVAAAEPPSESPIPDDIAKAINEVARWWTDRQGQTPQARPVFKRTNLVTRSIRVNDDLLKAAQEKAGQEAARTGGDLNSLIELLLWEYIGRDPRFIR